MPKRAAADTRPSPEKFSRSVSGQGREKPSEDEMGEFEDAWEDEIEDEDEDATQGGDGTCDSLILLSCGAVHVCVHVL